MWRPHWSCYLEVIWLWTCCYEALKEVFEPHRSVFVNVLQGYGKKQARLVCNYVWYGRLLCCVIQPDPVMTLYLVVAPVKWTLSQIYEASSVALVSPLICAVLSKQMSLHACPQNTVPLKAGMLTCAMRDRKREGRFDPMIDLDYAQPMWPSVARLLDDSSKVLQFCTSRPIHLNWIVELLAKPSLRTYLIADSVEVCCSPRPTCLTNVWGCFRA